MPTVIPIVYVVDDDISVRESLEGLIRQAGWQPSVFASATAFLADRRATAPSCLILDATLADLDGLDLQQTIASQRAELPIILMTGYGDVSMTVRAMRAGAVEVLIKPFGDEALLGAIRGALELSAKTHGLAADLHLLQDRYAALSGREREVLALVVSGLMNKQVAGKLGISEITVKAHRGRVMRKMEARSLADLVNIAGKLGIPQ